MEEKALLMFDGVGLEADIEIQPIVEGRPTPMVVKGKIEYQGQVFLASGRTVNGVVADLQRQMRAWVNQAAAREKEMAKLAAWNAGKARR